MIYNLKQAIFFDKKTILINKNKLKKALWPEKLYTTITNDQYQLWLQKMYDSNSCPIFNEFLIINKTENDTRYNEIMAAWSEHYWYWFVYWRLHLTKAECDSISNVLEKTSEVTSFVADFLEQAGAEISKTLISHVSSLVISFIANNWVTKNGMIIHFVTFIPVYFEAK